MQGTATNMATQVADAISSSPHIARAGVTYETHQGHVVLKGTVTSYFQKQMAQEALRGVEGVSQIDNELVVRW